MANNRLYIEDTETGELLMVAKSFGDGWHWRKSDDEINDWLEKKKRDFEATSGSTSGTWTTLRLVTEHELFSKGKE